MQLSLGGVTNVGSLGQLSGNTASEHFEPE